MGNFNKQLKKFSPKERREIEYLVERIIKRDMTGLHCKKLRGIENLFRVRKGKIRIIFELKHSAGPNIIAIERRREDTYKFL